MLQIVGKKGQSLLLEINKLIETCSGKFILVQGKKSFMLSSGDHLLPQARKTPEADWIQI